MQTRIWKGFNKTLNSTVEVSLHEHDHPMDSRRKHATLIVRYIDHSNNYGSKQTYDIGLNTGDPDYDTRYFEWADKALSMKARGFDPNLSPEPQPAIRSRGRQSTWTHGDKVYTERRKAMETRTLNVIKYHKAPYKEDNTVVPCHSNLMAWYNEAQIIYAGGENEGSDQEW